MTKRKTSLWTKVLLVSLGIIFLMSIVSSALTVGEKLGAQYPFISYIYYGLILIIVGFGIIYPIFGVFSSPIFSLEKLHQADGSARLKWCRRLADNLIKNVELTEEEKEQVRGYLKMEDETDDKLIEFFDRKIRPEINAEISDTAKKVFLITAISQNSVYDMLGMASANFCLVRRIVEICGFRPTTPQVLQLYIKVLSYSIIAGGLEDLNIEEILPMIAEGSVGKIGNIVFESTTQGIWNALMTIRIAVITKNYLLNADVTQTRKELRKKSFAESGKILKQIISESVEHKVTDPIKNLFRRKKTDEKLIETIE